MKKLVTNELSLGLDQNLRNNLIDNFKKIQDGVDGQSDSVNKQIKDMLGDVPLQDQNEVTQARIDANGKQFETMKSRLDVDQATAETALEEERQTGNEVTQARTNSLGKYHQNLSERLNDQENELTNSINEKLSQISLVPEAFPNLESLKREYPNGNIGIFVTTDNGHKYIWQYNQWQDVGVYQSMGISAEQMLNVEQFIFNEGNLLENGFFNDLNGIKPWSNTKLQANVMLGKHWVTATSSITNRFSGLELPVQDVFANSWSNSEYNALQFEFDILSNYEVTLQMELDYFTDDGQQLVDPVSPLILSAGIPRHEKIVFAKNAIYSGKHISLIISDYVSEPVNFSVANVKVTPMGV